MHLRRWGHPRGHRPPPPIKYDAAAPITGGITVVRDSPTPTPERPKLLDTVARYHCTLAAGRAAPGRGG